MSAVPPLKNIILVGGGHAHALVIKFWGMHPVPDARLVLISPQVQTPYSGMLPGLIAGHYAFDDIHINLPALCQWAGVQFIQDRVVAMDPKAKTVRLEDETELNYDLLSLDIGSTPNYDIPGVSKFAVPIKPIADFYSQWQEVRKTIEHKHDGQKIVVVGGGAGSVETILAMAHSLESDPATRGKCRFTLVYKNSELLPGYSSGLIAKVKTACLRYGIQLKADFNVVRVEHNSLYGSENATEDFDFLFWCTHASAASWTADSGLACDEDGFVTVNTCLQSVSSPDVFAAGDIAHMEANPRPKAGVYAVRQGPYLYDNLRARILGEPLKNYVPQRQFLSLLALGDKNAVGLRAPFPAFCGAWVWRWKNNIDQKFMSGFSKLPPKAPNKSN